MAEGAGDVELEGAGGLVGFLAGVLIVGEVVGWFVVWWVGEVVAKGRGTCSDPVACANADAAGVLRLTLQIE